MKNNRETTAQTPKDLLTELHALVAEAEKLIADSAAEQVDETAGALHLRIDAAQECLADLYAGAKKQVVTGAKCADSAIRNNPYQSLAIVGGIGLLAGILLGRRSR